VRTVLHALQPAVVLGGARVTGERARGLVTRHLPAAIDTAAQGARAGERHRFSEATDEGPAVSVAVRITVPARIARLHVGAGDDGKKEKGRLHLEPAWMMVVMAGCSCFSVMA